MKDTSEAFVSSCKHLLQFPSKFSRTLQPKVDKTFIMRLTKLHFETFKVLAHTISYFVDAL